MLGPYIVFLCSTITGYEGTGRSMTLKLIQELRRQEAKCSSSSTRTLWEVTLLNPIRYAIEDEVEKWLNRLLCLNPAENTLSMPCRLPHPDECELYYINRDT